jgi:hypothetical protein
MGKNVLIPLILLEQIIKLLDAWDTSGRGEWLRDRHSAVLGDLKEKTRRIDLRDAYYKVARADSPEAKSEALSKYLAQKNMGGVSVLEDDPFAGYYKYGLPNHKSIRRE